MSKKSKASSKSVHVSNSMTQKQEDRMLRPSARKTILYALAAGTAVVIALGILVPQKKPSGDWVPYDEARSAVAQSSGARVLTSDVPSFDFGRISMAAGNVSHRYSIKNTGTTPLTITKIFTSCMCTTATLITRSAKKGPFGMAGHGVLPRVSERLAPGELAQVDVVFDPAAHGPAGVGPTSRVVTIANDAGRALELRFNAMVTP